MSDLSNWKPLIYRLCLLVFVIGYRSPLLEYNVDPVMKVRVGLLMLASTYIGCDISITRADALKLKLKVPLLSVNITREFPGCIIGL